MEIKKTYFFFFLLIFSSRNYLVSSTINPLQTVKEQTVIEVKQPSIVTMKESAKVEKIRLQLKKAAEYELDYRGTFLLFVKKLTVLAVGIILSVLLAWTFLFFFNNQMLIWEIKNNFRNLKVVILFSTCFFVLYKINQLHHNATYKSLIRPYSSYRNTMTIKELKDLIAILNNKLDEEELNRLLLSFIEVTILSSTNKKSWDIIKNPFCSRMAWKTRKNFENLKSGTNDKIIKVIIQNYQWTAKDFLVRCNFVDGLFTVFIVYLISIHLSFFIFLTYLLQNAIVGAIQHSYYKKFIEDIKKIEQKYKEHMENKNKSNQTSLNTL